MLIKNNNRMLKVVQSTLALIALILNKQTTVEYNWKSFRLLLANTRDDKREQGLEIIEYTTH